MSSNTSASTGTLPQPSATDTTPLTTADVLQTVPAIARTGSMDAIVEMAADDEEKASVDDTKAALDKIKQKAQAKEHIGQKQWGFLSRNKDLFKKVRHSLCACTFTTAIHLLCR